jgi:hypothetical protein
MRPSRSKRKGYEMADKQINLKLDDDILTKVEELSKFTGIGSVSATIRYLIVKEYAVTFPVKSGYVTVDLPHQLDGKQA